MTSFRSGFVSVVGRPNVGKSSLVNTLIGEKIVITSAKPQTTRNRTRAILTTPQAQIIFYDTPGLHKPQHRLGEEMNKIALQTFSMVDTVLWVIDATRAPGKGDLWVASRLYELAEHTRAGSRDHILVAFNKIDLVSVFSPEVFLKEVGVSDLPWIRISALTGEGIPLLLERLTESLPVGPKYYPEEMITDQPEALIISDLIREGIIDQTAEEIPHSVAVMVEEVRDRPKRMVYIRATILVERDSQKKIMIGKSGERLRQIGIAGRKAIEEYLGQPVYLDLWVKTKADWRNSPEALRELGYIERD